jgi:hypothetical protein
VNKKELKEFREKELSSKEFDEELLAIPNIVKIVRHKLVL